MQDSTVTFFIKSQGVGRESGKNSANSNQHLAAHAQVASHLRLIFEYWVFIGNFPGNIGPFEIHPTAQINVQKGEL